MTIYLNKNDNEVILNHLYKYNQTVETGQKMAMDFYIESINFSDDITFKGIRIEPILDKSCEITEDNVGGSRGEIGDSLEIKISQFESPYREIIFAAIREIKLNKII